MATPVSLMDDQMVDMAFITQLTGLTVYIPILVTICTWRQRSRHCGRDSLSLQDILSGIRECPPECKQDDI
ncbi:hypothetical protein [Escherichia coli]|uniref:hypothetical protein n=1 Tax=Escherichia coli TaxID=562 RepID=UPI00288C5977|nr:hypothetical protein [Escherichia coli]